MNTLFQRFWVLSCAVALCLTSCGTEIGGVLYVVGNTIPESSTCLVQAQGGGGQQKFRPNGVIDLSVTDRYRAYLMVVNEAPQFESISGFEAEDGRVDQSKILLDTATVSMSVSRDLVEKYGLEMNKIAQSLGFGNQPWPQTSEDVLKFDDYCTQQTDGLMLTSGQCTTTFTLSISAELPPGATAAVIMDLLPANYGRMLRMLPFFVNANDMTEPLDSIPPPPISDLLGLDLGPGELELVFEITLAGKRHDGKRVSSEPFRYPVTVCNHCLVQNLFEDAVAENPLNPAGTAEPITAEEILGDLCAPGSDEVVPNAWCGLVYPGTANKCPRDRCLDGKGQPAPGLSLKETLYCPQDGVSLSANPL